MKSAIKSVDLSITQCKRMILFALTFICTQEQNTKVIRYLIVFSFFRECMGGLCRYR